MKYVHLEAVMAERDRQVRRLEFLSLSLVVLVVVLVVALVNAVLFPGQPFWVNLRAGVGIALGMIIAYLLLKRARRKR